MDKDLWQQIYYSQQMNLKNFLEKRDLIDRKKIIQEHQNSLIVQAENCLKAFKSYVGFLNDKDYIKFEEIKNSTEQFIKIYEELFDLEPETPKKLGCLFRLTKIAFRLILTMENNFSGKDILYSKEPLLEEYIEFIDEEIAELKQKYFKK